MSRLINAFEQFFDGAGDPLVNGKLWFYTSGSSTTAKDTFANSDETIPNTNPVILTGDGRAPNVFGTGTYRVILTNSSDVQIIQRDPIGGDGAIAFGADWISTQVYSINDVVRDDGEYWVSLIAGNQNIRPSTDGGSNWIRWPDDILNATILGGTIDNTIIGGTTPAAGSFTTVDINGGTIDGVAIGAETPSTGDFTTLTATTGTISDNLKTQRTVINFASDANYTLTAAQNNYSQVEMTDTGVVLTAAKDVLFDATPRLFSFINSAAQILTPKVSGGAGPAIPADGRLYNLYSDGTDIVINPSELQLGTPIATTSGTSHDFTIPSWARKVTASISGVTRSGTSPIIFQIGDSGGIEATSYTGAATSITSAAQNVQNNSTGFHIGGDASVVNTAVFTGAAILSVHDESTNSWNLTYDGGRSDAANAQFSAGAKALSGKLTTVRLTTSGGTDTFTAGSFNVMYE